jgi:hypothetical protein
LSSSLDDTEGHTSDHAAETANHSNNITPFHNKGDVPEDVKLEEQDIKPSTKKHVSTATTQKNSEIDDFLISHLVPLRPVLANLRETQRTAKSKVSVPQLVRWINEIHYLQTTYKTVTMSDAPASIRNKRIFSENWRRVILRSTSYLAQCMTAHTFIQERKHEWDIEQYLMDEEQMAGVDSLVNTINNKSWVKVYTRPPRGPRMCCGMSQKVPERLSKAY